MRLAAACAAILLTGCQATAPQPTGPQPSGYTRHYGDQQTELIEACQEAVEASARKHGITPELAKTPEVEAIAKRIFQRCLMQSGASL